MKNLAFLLTAFLLVVAEAGCGGHDKACEDTCESDNDCETGLSCWYTSTANAKVCVPWQCGDCFKNAQTCYYSTSANDSSDLMCDFTTCDN